MFSNKNIYNAENVRWLKTISLLFCLCFLFSPVKAQTKATKNNVSKKPCKIALTVFKCPEDFVKVQMIGNDTILFKRDYEGSIIYFFVSMPKGVFDDGKIKQAIGSEFTSNKSAVFRWNEINKPFVMDLETKYEKKITSSIGFNDTELLNFISRHFEFNKQEVVFGYGYRTEMQGNEAKNLFESGSGIGDNAIGCNAIATTLNSITKEKKGALQYCTLSAFTTS